MKRIMALFALVMFTLVLTASSSFVAAQSVPERQPHMTAALEHLRQAQKELETATHDKGGHRVKALSLVKQAITHVEEGLRYDDTHTSPQEKKKGR
jgi:acyl-CoA reductase-like NAD-dependent aldehyde dehydrogenase